MATRKWSAALTFSSSSSSGNCDSSSASSKRRQFTKATFKKWQREHQREHQTLSWLRCVLCRDKLHVEILYCEVCRKYEARLCSFRNFSNSWIKGSANLKLSNMLDHARSDVHLAAMSKLRADLATESGESTLLHTPLGRCVVNLDEVALGRLKLKFNICYMMAKQSLPFAKYLPLLELQAHHGADLGSSYNTPDSAKIFTTYIAKSLQQSFLNTISASNISFFSFLADGTTDSNNQDDELIIVVYCAKNNLTEELSVCTRFISLCNPTRGNAAGLHECICEALKFMGIEALNVESVLGVSGRPVLVSGGSDGATVNIADSGGLKGMMQRSLPWIHWSWCYAHRLELACKNVFQSPLYTLIQEMLLRLYYLYERSPKKSRELDSITESLKEVFVLPKGGNRPVRSQGTRWISHKRRALQHLLDCYGMYIAHLTSLASDSSVKPIDRAKLKGYLGKWKQPKVLIGTALFIEVLKPASVLSLTLQCDNIDVYKAY